MGSARSDLPQGIDLGLGSHARYSSVWPVRVWADTERGLVHSFVFVLAVLSMHVCVWCVSLGQRQLGQSVQQVL